MRMTARMIGGVFTSTVLAVVTAAAVGAARPDIGLVFMSPEQYLARWGRPAPTGPDIAADAAREIVTKVYGPLHQQTGAGWAIIKWDEHDLRGVSTPVREGNSALGFAHYAFNHNLTSGAPIHAAFQTHRPDKEFGAHAEYTSLAVSNNGDVRLTIRVIVQTATSTDDRVYRTSDGKNIGVITAYCEGMNVCPGWVNSVP